MCLNPKTIKSKNPASENYIGKLYYDDGNGNAVNIVPCGKCIECKNLYIESWSIRWKEEILNAVENSSYMLTLTYSDENLPKYIIDKETGESKGYVENGVLQYSDVAGFVKRLRSRQARYCKKIGIDNPKISYHYCGEYGTKGTRRPHYHILLVNVILPIDGITNFKNNTFKDIWKNGHVHIGTDVNEKSIRYVLKYTLKHSLKPVSKKKIQDIVKVDYKVDFKKSFLIDYHSVQDYVDDFNYMLNKDPLSVMSYPFGLGQQKLIDDYATNVYESYKKTEYVLSNSENYESEEYSLRTIAHIYTEGPNIGRVCEKSVCSKGIGKGYLTEQNISFHHQNLNLGYMDYEEGKGWKEKPLPRYYRDYIFNPVLKTEEKKEYLLSIGYPITEESMKRSIRKYKEQDDDFTESLVYKKRLIMFQRFDNERRSLVKYIIDHGEERFYSERRAFKAVKEQGYFKRLTSYLSEVSRREPEFV